MDKCRTVYVVDDDPLIVEVVALLLRDAGYEVRSNTSSQQALQEIQTSPPDVVVLDIMMSDLDGLEFCRELRQRPEFAATTIIMLSAKAYEFDRRRAFQFGANGYIQKPVDPKSFLRQFEEILSDDVTLTFWGVRGTLPVPGEKSLRYGGNTVCVTLALPKERLFIFDAGTGIKSLSDNLLARRQAKLSAKIFISHPHWDHINALPFFVPLYIKGNEFEICGPQHGDVGMRELISAQMDDIYFPITMKEFSARVYFKNFREGSYQIDGIEVRTMLLNHPGYCLGYRIVYGQRNICYITDQELFPEASPSYDRRYRERLTEFIRGADVFITDCTYFDDEYPGKEGWGHSSIGEVVHFAHAAGVKRLYLYHHDPDHSDDDIDRKLDYARNILQELGSTTQCIAPREKEPYLV